MAEMSEPTYNMQPTPLEITGTYYPLRFRIGPVAKERARAVAAAILAGYLGRHVSYSKWRAAGELVVSWSDDNKSRRNRSHLPSMISARISPRVSASCHQI